MLSVDDADTDLETATVNELQPKRSELYQALESSAHLPVSTASAERSFRTMGRLKTYLTKYDD